MSGDSKPERQSITRKSIVKSISNETGLSQKLTKQIVERVFDSIVDTLIASGRLELRNFGVFEVRKRAARTGRNPKTACKVHVPEKYVVTFKPGKDMEEKVQRLMLEREGDPAEPVETSDTTTTNESSSLNLD